MHAKAPHQQSVTRQLPGGPLSPLRLPGLPVGGNISGHPSPGPGPGAAPASSRRGRLGWSLLLQGPAAHASRGRGEPPESPDTGTASGLTQWCGPAGQAAKAPASRLCPQKRLNCKSLAAQWPRTCRRTFTGQLKAPLRPSPSRPRPAVMVPAASRGRHDARSGQCSPGRPGPRSGWGKWLCPGASDSETGRGLSPGGPRRSYSTISGLLTGGCGDSESGAQPALAESAQTRYQAAVERARVPPWMPRPLRDSEPEQP